MANKVDAPGAISRNTVNNRLGDGAKENYTEQQIKNECVNIASENYMTNIEVVRTVRDWLGKDESSIEFVPNRWGQDVRYAVDATKLRSIGWLPSHPSGLYRWF